jgi:protein-tyrosine phosphatase
MAEGLFAAALPGSRVSSAGLGALVGHPADETAVRLLRSRGIDISGHRATQINKQLCLESDIVLVMDAEQRRRMEEMYPQARGRIFRLGEVTKQDVLDPYRRPEQAFVDALTLIEQCVHQWVQRIHKL